MYVYVRAWVMRRRRHVVRQRARRTFALITFLSVTDIYTYIHRRPCCTTSAYVYGTQEEPRGKQYVTRAHTASCTWIRAQHAGRRGGGHTETIMASIGDSPNIPVIALASETPPVASMSMCRRRHVHICTCMGDASPMPCMWYGNAHAVRSR